MLSGAALANEPLALKGLPLGATLADVQRSYPSAKCPGDDKATMCIASYEITSRDLVGRPGYPDSLEAVNKEMSVAGANMRTIMFHLHEGALERISMMPSPDVFEKVSTALIDRYGVPTSDESSIVRTKAGVEHTNRVIYWKLGGGFIRYSRFGSSVRNSSLTYSTYEALERMKRRAEESRKKAASDL